MKVKDLRVLLADMDGELEVIIQKDGEGNSYSPCSGGSDSALYEAETTWSGNVHDLSWSAADMDMDEDEWEEFKKKHPRVCVLYPTN